MSDSTIPLKKCSKCGFSIEPGRAAEFFSVDARKRDGLRSQCKTCIAAYRISRREQRKSYDAEYYKTHRENMLAKTHVRFMSPESRKKARAVEAAYRATLKGKLVRRAKNQRRRARRRDTGKYSVIELQAVIAAHTDKNGVLHCALCGKPIEGQYHIDHWIPLKDDGPNVAGNLRIMHPRCNLTKHSKHPHKLGLLI